MYGWCDILNFEVDRKVYINNNYDCMLTKNECDLKWKIMQGAIATDRLLFGCEFSDSPKCNYCGELDDLNHICIICNRLLGLFQLTVWRYIIGIPASSDLVDYVRRLGNKHCSCS